MALRSVNEPYIKGPTAMPWPISARWRAAVTSGISVMPSFCCGNSRAHREATAVLFPGPLATVQAVVALLHDGVPSRDVLTSLMRIGIGFALGVLVGVPIGLAMGTFRPIKIFLRALEQGKISEGSADIDADAPRHWFNRLLSAARWSSCLRDDPPGET